MRNIATSSTSEVFEQIMHIGEGDVFIAITFPRYSKRTLKAAKYAHENIILWDRTALTELIERNKDKTCNPVEIATIH